MEYYFSKVLKVGFEEAEKQTVEALKKEGFGIVSEINMHEKFKAALGVDFKKYKILGACKPSFALKAVQMEDKVGVMLPCNVVLIEKDDGSTEVAAVDPKSSMMAINNPGLASIASEVTEILKKLINGL